MSEKPNVVPFERDADFLRQRALKNQKDNHLIDALELMRKAVEAQPDNDEYRMELAQLLTEVGCPERSNREWLTLIYDPDNRGRCFYGGSGPGGSGTFRRRWKRRVCVCTRETWGWPGAVFGRF